MGALSVCDQRTASQHLLGFCTQLPVSATGKRSGDVMHYCECGCFPCWRQTGPHEPCAFLCTQAVPKIPDRRRVLGGKPGREIIAIDSLDVQPN